MKDKSIWKISIDFAMTVLVLCQMAYLLIGETEHEWMGTFLFSLFGLHHLLNVRWYGNLFRGRYTVYRAMQSVLNMLLFVSMGGCMISGMIISKEVFAFLPINGGRGLARKVHMLSSY